MTYSCSVWRSRKKNKGPKAVEICALYNPKDRKAQQQAAGSILRSVQPKRRFLNCRREENSRRVYRYMVVLLLCCCGGDGVIVVVDVVVG